MIAVASLCTFEAATVISDPFSLSLARSLFVSSFFFLFALVAVVVVAVCFLLSFLVLIVKSALYSSHTK